MINLLDYFFLDNSQLKPILVFFRMLTPTGSWLFSHQTKPGSLNVLAAKLQHQFSHFAKKF